LLEAYGAALATLFQPINLLILLSAVLTGLIIGVIPGISGMVMLPLLLPFLFRMPAEVALILLIAFHAVIFTGGSITSILLNIPGTGPNAATMLDGFPMTQRGEGGRAIGAGTVIEDCSVENSIILENCRLRGVKGLVNSLIGRRAAAVKGEDDAAVSLFLGSDAGVEL
jgi:TctA family transporter